jgi:hypothetical protein
VDFLNVFKVARPAARAADSAPLRPGHVMTIIWFILSLIASNIGAMSRWCSTRSTRGTATLILAIGLDLAGQGGHRPQNSSSCRSFRATEAAP